LEGKKEGKDGRRERGNDKKGLWHRKDLGLTTIT